MAVDFTDLILSGAKSAGIGLTHRQAELCRLHIELMLEWNLRVNLTRITDRGDIIVKHLLDSLCPAPELPASGRALDVGSGAGFPGIPLKIFSPDLDMVLLDSNRKKVSFLALAAARLGLKGIRAVHARWDDFAGSPENRNAFRLITMRAVRLEPRHLSILAAQTLSPGGVFAWWAGPESGKASETVAEERFPGLEFSGSLPYTLPGAAKTRSILTWEKRKAQ